MTRVNLEVPVASERTDGANIRRIGLTELLTNQDAAADRWDGLIVHDPEGELVNRRSRDDIASLLDWAGARIAQSGFVYLGIANPLVGATVGKCSAASPSFAPCRALRRRRTLLRRASWSPSRKYPLLLDGSRVVQVLGSLGYRSTKNREAPRTVKSCSWDGSVLLTSLRHTHSSAWAATATRRSSTNSSTGPGKPLLWRTPTRPFSRNIWSSPATRR